ncbi:hypothetical protein E2C01_042759 [Portunus trituberculatus]|uniref:Uncharacterized protein n=1 Tax=Portunus trituberculatus TaxID=210409 RepID=A0A5B7FR29_PORTR|nr:hypothetical protein [Portunus trituberculatus]
MLKSKSQGSPYLTDIDPSIVDVSQMVKMGIQVTLMSNLTHPALLVLGKGVVLPPGVYTSASVSLTEVRDTGLKTEIDLSETQCVPLDQVNYLTDLEGFFTVEQNCDLGAARICINQFYNCTNYAMNTRMSHDHLPPCQLVDHLHLHWLLLRVLGLDTHKQNKERVTSKNASLPEEHINCIKNAHPGADDNTPVDNEEEDSKRRQYMKMEKEELVTHTLRLKQEVSSNKNVIQSLSPQRL